MSKTCPPKPHAIVFPYPYQGHITPTVNLAIKLASYGFVITYVQPEFIHHTISKAHGHDPRAHGFDIFVKARESGLDIRYTTISDGFSLEFDRDANLTEYWESMVLDFPARVDELVESIKRISDESASGFLLVADSLYSWPAAIAMKSDVNLLINYIPGVESINGKDLISFIQAPDAVPVLVKVAIKGFEQVKNADFILCNTVEELEPNPLSALNQKQPTFAIGPINFFTKTSLQKSLRPESDFTDWLSSKPQGSVLYISFGSILQASKQEIKEIAHGLLLSRVNFIWILRTDNMESNQNDLFPVGFLDDAADRGIIIPWCNQNVVLSSEAVGGFLTHCGWNSILESMWSGVPMICYPFFVDQPTNRKLVVEDWKIGINLCDGGEVTRAEVVRKIDILMKGETCCEFREAVKKVSAILRNALEKDGSSDRNFDQFVHDLKVLLCDQ